MTMRHSPREGFGATPPTKCTYLSAQAMGILEILPHHPIWPVRHSSVTTQELTFNVGNDEKPPNFQRRWAVNKNVLCFRGESLCSTGNAMLQDGGR